MYDVNSVSERVGRQQRCDCFWFGITCDQWICGWTQATKISCNSRGLRLYSSLRVLLKASRSCTRPHDLHHHGGFFHTLADKPSSFGRWKGDTTNYRRRYKGRTCDRHVAAPGKFYLFILSYYMCTNNYLQLKAWGQPLWHQTAIEGWRDSWRRHVASPLIVSCTYKKIVDSDNIYIYI